MSFLVHPEFLTFFGTGFLVSLGVFFLAGRAEGASFLRRARLEGDKILREVRDDLDHQKEDKQTRIRDLKGKKEKSFEKEKMRLEASLNKLHFQIEEIKDKMKFKQDEEAQVFEKLKKIRKTVSKKEEGLSEEKNIQLKEIESLKEEYLSNLEKKFSLSRSKIKELLKAEIQKNFEKETKKLKEDLEKRSRDSLLRDSRFHLEQALNRFDRIYCSQRGIGHVSFNKRKKMEQIMGKNKENLAEIEKECGVDIVVQEEERQAFIYGIDPVRRELGRLTLKDLIRKPSVNSQVIKKSVKNMKKTLFARIKKDGNDICRRLELKQVAPEVKNMMGALRYRYSFAQNQYFHCEEVGFLCGLLSLEMGLPLEEGRRSGMLHDIGKAMDHSIEGNHAVIGAEFIDKYGEKKEVVHAVRAHHHDEAPSTPLAHLTIVADAISGSRPGARRFTEDSYKQKMDNLERIIHSFDHLIEDAYIMSAGREMRVIVDHKKVSDEESLDLSRKIARKIEKECSYPGLIKVTVVRHSEKVAMA